MNLLARCLSVYISWHASFYIIVGGWNLLMEARFRVCSTLETVPTPTHSVPAFFPGHPSPLSSPSREFSRQQYFDSHGLFITIMFSTPILINCIVMLVSLRRSARPREADEGKERKICGGADKRSGCPAPRFLQLPTPSLFKINPQPFLLVPPNLNRCFGLLQLRACLSRSSGQSWHSVRRLLPELPGKSPKLKRTSSGFRFYPRFVFNRD